jgi:hypothetical protein
MVVGSVVWVRPSPRDQRLAEWRRKAIMSGLKVKLEGVAAEPKESGIRTDLEGVSYILYKNKPIKGDDKKWMVVNYDGWLKDELPDGWSWHKEESLNLSAALSDLIKNAPLPILAIERTPYLSRIVWNESAGDFDSEKLKDFLQIVQVTS